MMKKLFIILGLLLIFFIIALYISLSGTSKEFSTCEILTGEGIEAINFKEYDSVLVAASTLYEGNALKEIMQGANYRKAWATPVKVPIIFLDTLMGGMKIIDEGGGKQTHSLELEAADGIHYTLRSITKDPEKLVPQFARTLGLQNIVIDGISAQHPYAAVVVAALAEAAGLLHTHPEIVFVPRQEVLGKYNTKYGNRLYLLEYEAENDSNWTTYDNVLKITDTKGLQELKLRYHQGASVDHKALVRARLFDLVIGDWDRHAKQWGWVICKVDQRLIAVPLACDRDNAFFKIEGIVPTLVSNEKIIPGLQSFEKDIDYLPGLVMPFDVYFLKGVPKEVFVNEAKKLQELLTDKVIDNSFKVWPSSISSLDAKDIAAKVKIRRNDLLAYSVGFKDALDEMPELSEPLKGSEDVQLSKGLMACFDCE